MLTDSAPHDTITLIHPSLIPFFILPCSFLIPSFLLKFFLPFLLASECVYGYVRIETGDELSKRAKFALITWVGPSVKATLRAAVSTDKAIVKGVIQVGKQQ